MSDVNRRSPGLLATDFVAVSSIALQTAKAQMEPAPASDEEHEPKLPTSGSFSWNQFLAQLPLQLFLPLSLPIAALYSPALALNILGLPKPATLAHLPALLLLLTLQGAPLVAVLAWLAMPAETAPNSLLAATLRADALHVIVALASLRTAVSFKYAFMPSETYARRCSAWATTQERSEEQLVSGWQFLKPALVQRCLGIAAAEQHVDAAGAAVRLPRGALPHLLSALECDKARAAVTQAIAAAEGAEACEQGAAQLRSASTNASINASASASSHCSIPAIALSQALVLAASREASLFAGRAFVINLLTALGSTFTTTILRAALGAPMLGTSAAEATLILGHIFANLFSLGVTLQFLFIGAIDHLRRARAAALLGRLFSLRAGGRPALLPLDCPGNVQALVAVRAMLLDFGRHFHERLVLVVSFSLITFACVAAYVIVALYRAPSGDLAPLLSPFILLHVLVLPALVSCGLSLHQASHANSEMGKLGAVVVEARLHERLRRAAEAEGPLLALLGDCESLFNAQGDKGIRILNATASGALTQAFLGAWLSLESTALVLFLQRLYGS